MNPYAYVAFDRVYFGINVFLEEALIPLLNSLTDCECSST